MRKDRRERFVELAENRVNKAIRYLRLVGNLSNKSNYVYDDNDVKKIFSTLEVELRATKSRFEEAAKKSEDTFKL